LVTAKLDTTHWMGGTVEKIRPSGQMEGTKEAKSPSKVKKQKGAGKPPCGATCKKTIEIATEKHSGAHMWARFRDGKRGEHALKAALKSSRCIKNRKKGDLPWAFGKFGQKPKRLINKVCPKAGERKNAKFHPKILTLHSDLGMRTTEVGNIFPAELETTLSLDVKDKINQKTTEKHGRRSAPLHP